MGQMFFLAGTELDSGPGFQTPQPQPVTCEIFTDPARKFCGSGSPQLWWFCA